MVSQTTIVLVLYGCLMLGCSWLILRHIAQASRRVGLSGVATKRVHEDVSTQIKQADALIKWAITQQDHSDSMRVTTAEIMKSQERLAQEFERTQAELARFQASIAARIEKHERIVSDQMAAVQSHMAMKDLNGSILSPAKKEKPS